MEQLLYVYDANKLSNLKENLSKYRFTSIAYFLYLCDTLDKLETLELENSNHLVVDITNIVKDGVFYQVFTERYLYTLIDTFDDIHFCINYDYLDTFQQRFPYFFNENNINFYFHEEETANNKTKIELHNNLPLYLYDNSTILKKIIPDNKLISLSNLIDECEGISFKYNIDRIFYTLEQEKIEYVDISSVVKTLKVRRDLTFLFEILIHQIMKLESLNLTLETSLYADILELFPLIFGETIKLEENETIEETISVKSTALDITLLNSQFEKINASLKGHSLFKQDFKQNLMKFAFLNKIGERKILSVLLCGDSGIGKTEFAKIVSNTLFPDEDLIKINFGNYSSEGVLNSLIGSPLGYIGSEEGGELINKIATSKSKVILIDEFERATPSVYNFFYELLEDGIFTDRHGVAHDLNEYIIVFTSNMTQSQYQKHIPNSLKSRFDMVYYFIDLPVDEKIKYISNTANKLISRLNQEFKTNLLYENIESKLNNLVGYNNLRDIKRKIEDIVFNEFFEILSTDTV